MTDAVEAAQTIPLEQDGEKLVRIYRKIRAAREEISAEFKKKDEALKEQLEQVSQMLLNLMDAQNVLGMQTGDGSVRKVVKQKFWCTDWAEFNKFVKETDNLDLFERRIAQTNMAEWLANNPEKIPPGLQMDRRYDVLVQKPRQKPE